MGVSREQDLAELGLDGQCLEEKKIRHAYITESKKRHPDRGGTKESFQRLSNAYQRLVSNRYPMRTTNNTVPSHRHDKYSRPTSSGKSQRRAGEPDASDQQPHYGQRTSSTSRPPRDSNSDNSAYYDDDDDAGFWNDAYFHFFRQAWSGNGHRRRRYDNFDAYFTCWETTTRKERARQRYENVKCGFDFRDRKATDSSCIKCTFCEKNHPISKSDALEHGLDWKEYAASKRRFQTCWACKNSHKSVLTQRQAIQKFTANKVHVLEGTCVFGNLRKSGWAFHHQPVTDYAEVTRNSLYFWYPDLEKAAMQRGWKPRGRTPELCTSNDTRKKPASTSSSNCKRRLTDPLRTPSKCTKLAAFVTVSGGRKNSDTTIPVGIPKKLFQEEARKKPVSASSSNRKRRRSTDPPSTPAKCTTRAAVVTLSGGRQKTDSTIRVSQEKATPKKLFEEEADTDDDKGDWRVSSVIDY